MLNVITTEEEYRNFFEEYARYYRKELNGKRFAICGYCTACDCAELIEAIEEDNKKGWIEEWYQSLVDDSDMEILETFDTLEDAKNKYDEEYAETYFSFCDGDAYANIYLLVEFDDGFPEELEYSKGVLALEELKEWEA